MCIKLMIYVGGVWFGGIGTFCGMKYLCITYSIIIQSNIKMNID